MSDKALMVVTVTMSAPNAPTCFELREDFPQNAAAQIQELLKRHWPMMTWNVDLQGTTQ